MDTAASAPDFADTRPVGDQAAPAARRTEPPRRFTVWAESALDLASGTDIVELPDDAVGDLMDEFFARSEKKAA